MNLDQHLHLIKTSNMMAHQHEFKYKNYINNQLRSQQSFNHCTKCGQQTHQTIDCFHKQTTGCFNCRQNYTIRDCTMPSTSFPAYIKIRVNDQPTEAIVDTGSAISIIRLDFLKIIHHNNLTYQTRTCQTANSASLTIIGQIELEIKINYITASVITDVATNLITSILLCNDWINSNHVHVFGNQKKLTIPNKHGQLISIPYVEPIEINYPALLVNQITLPSYSQTLVDIACKVNDANDFIFEPYQRHISKFIFIPHTLLNITKHQAKVLLINAQDRQQILSRNT
ncbi:unnamed protein product [Rotaria sp. Silwood2]|nr:unnamed protein product [Rotaria sp. Silwood2]CAF3145822.1 unnamed protein product [Rotaria sp. Silwood2]CAF4176892.1 unnamed protein product [Rotaria sp. Silwood2]CAF4562989.1 unnamed protein product [Rotaria sp. Silwood2]